MKANLRIVLLAAMFLAQIFGCLRAESQQSVKIAGWNLQTFFDSTPSGNEYSGFKKNDSNWNDDKYRVRLQRLCSVLEVMDADIVVLEEIENSGIIYDIINFYSGQARRDKAYISSCFAGENGQAFGIAILSRYEIQSYSQHSLDIRDEDEKMPQMRPTLSARICVGDRVLSVFGCHWKSKVSGADEGQLWRNHQKDQLARLIEKEKRSGASNGIIVLGDFNQDLCEFKIETMSDCKRKVRLSGNTLLNSCWLTFDSRAENDNSYGSYYYQGEWNKIDHIFYDDRVTMTSFYAENGAGNVTAEGTPERYSQWTGNGISDHLPVCATIRF